MDRFWLLENEGIYLTDAEVPVVDGRRQSYNGIPLQAGDPRWVDKNGNNRIDDNDRVFMGNIFPKVSGGFANQFRYGNWTLDASFYFHLGRDILNNEMANRFDLHRKSTRLN